MSRPMDFSDETKHRARHRAGGRCECERKSHKHLFGRCSAILALVKVEYHHKTAVASGGSNALSNCEVLCVSCHQRIPRPKAA